MEKVVSVSSSSFRDCYRLLTHRLSESSRARSVIGLRVGWAARVLLVILIGELDVRGVTATPPFSRARARPKVRAHHSCLSPQPSYCEFLDLCWFKGVAESLL